MTKRNRNTKTYNISIPKILDEMVNEKMDILGYVSIGELCRELLRGWVTIDQ